MITMRLKQILIKLSSYFSSSANKGGGAQVAPPDMVIQQYARVIPPDHKQMLIDAMEITTSIAARGYSPINALKLLSIMYGAIAGSFPEGMKNTEGKDISHLEIEYNFFAECCKERVFVLDKRGTNYKNADENYKKRLS